MQGYRVCPRSLRFSDDKERPGIERIRQRDKDKERMAKTQKGTDRQTAREKERERKGGKDTERDRERDRQTARQRERKTETERDRERRETEERDRERQRETEERDRDRERGEIQRYRERERERDWYRGKKTNYFFLCHWNFNEKLVISFCTMAVPTHLFTTLALYCGDIDGFSSKEVQICSTLSSQLRAIFSTKWAF